MRDAVRGLAEMGEEGGDERRTAGNEGRGTGGEGAGGGMLEVTTRG